MTLAPGSAVERLRNGWTPLLFYPLLALVSFPTLGLLLWGKDALVYGHDLFDIPRIGGTDWLAAVLSLWNVHQTAGDPSLAQQAIGPYAIDVPLAALVGPFWALVVNSWFLAAVAGISMHLFLRDCLRLATVAVVGGSAIFLFSFWHPIIGFAIPATPLLLWLMEGALRGGGKRWRYVLAHVLLGALILYNGQSQIVVLVAVLEAAYLLVIASPGGRWRQMGLLVGMWALSFTMYGPVLLTQLVALPGSQRTVWFLYAIAPLDAIGAAVRFYAKILIGVPFGSRLGSPDVYGTYFLGAAGLPLLALGIVRRGLDRRGWLFVGLLFVIPLLDVGVSLARPLQEQAGFLKSFQFDRVRHFVPLALAVTAALGLDFVAGALAPGGSARRLGRWRLLAVGSSAIPIAANVAIVVVRLTRRESALTRPDQQTAGLMLFMLAMGLGILFVAAVVVWIRRRWAGAARLPALALLGLLAAILLERGLYAQAERLMGDDLATWRASRDVTPAQAFLLQQPGIGVDRVLTFGEDPNRMSAVGLLQADGYETIYPVAYHTLFGRLIRPQFDVDPTYRTYFDRWGNRVQVFGPRVEPGLVALVGARWLYVRGPPPPMFNPEYFSGTPWIPTVPGIIPRYRDAQVTVYEVPSVLPRAFIAGGLSVAPDDASVADSLAQASPARLRATAVVAAGPDAEALRSALAGTGSAGVAGTATITHYGSDQVSIEVGVDRPGILVLTDSWAPGWVADVDGQRTPILRVDEAFRGIVVPPGRHQVVFSYVPVFTYAGFALAGIGLVLLLGGVGLLRWRDLRAARNEVRARPGLTRSDPSSTGFPG